MDLMPAHQDEAGQELVPLPALPSAAAFQVQRAMRVGAVGQWRNDASGNWFCYWDGSLDMPRDRRGDYVFEPPLEVAQCGVVSTGVAGSLTQHAAPFAVYRAMHELLVVLGSCGLGDEGDGLWMPLVVPWDPQAGPVEPGSLLRRLGAHRELVESICVIGEHERAENLAEWSNVDPWSSVPHWPKPLLFHAGSDKLNPIPVLEVSHALPGLVVGCIGDVTHT